MNRKPLFLLSVILSLSLAASAQRQRNYIYLFDCTQSMEWSDIWQPAKTALDRTVNVQRMQPDASFTVIPFQGLVHPSFGFGSDGYLKVKPDMTEAFDGYIRTKTNTNIADALTEGLKQCSDEKDNRVYLLTDGTDNVKGPAEVCRIIDSWCASHTNTRFFYVTLAEEAVNPDIVAAINRCPDAFFVKCHNGVIPQLADLSQSRVYGSTLEPDRVYRIGFSEPGSYSLRADSSDPFFEPVIYGGKAENQSFELSLRLKHDMSVAELNDLLAEYADADGNYVFTVRIQSGDSGVTVVNPELTVVMSNRRQRSLDLLGGSTDELVVKPGARSHPAFLFSPAKNSDTVYVDLAPHFNKESGASTTATFRIADMKKKEKDYKILYNGHSVDDDGLIAVEPGVPAVVGVVFEPQAKTGKRYFSIVPASVSELELINGYPFEELPPLSFRTTYHRDWNPLATVLFWTGIVLLGALALWFIIFRPIFFPKFKVAALTFTGPGSYYVRKRVKKYRSVVLTSGKGNQSFFSRLFTGKILFVTAPHWTPELTITPGNKRTCRVTQNKKWDIVPSRTLKQHETYEFINNISGEKTGLTVE